MWNHSNLVPLFAPMHRFAIAFVVFASIVLTGAALSQDSASSSSALTQNSGQEVQAQTTPSSGSNGPYVLKNCSPKNPRPCADTPPRALYDPAPKYSKEARKKKIAGTVLILLIVGPNGQPRDIRVAQSLGYGLDEEAIKAVKKWKFKPATMDGQPVAIQINVEVDFRLY